MAVERTQLVAMLQAIQARDHYLAPEALRRVAEELGLSLAAVVGVATFYSQFRLRPAGAHTVRVCVGTACHVKGAETVYAAFRRELGIEGEDDTDAARRFTVEKVACIGCCMLAPAVQIDAVTYGPVEPASVGEVLRDFLARRTERDGSRTRRRAEGLPRGEVRVCCCSSCSAAGAETVVRAFEEEAGRATVPVVVQDVGCSGKSFAAPLVEVVDGDGNLHTYPGLSVHGVAAAWRKHFPESTVFARWRQKLQGGLETLLTGDPGVPSGAGQDASGGDPGAPYEKAQVRVVTEGAGVRGPLDIEAYRAAGGFGGWQYCRDGILAPDDVIERLKVSGLRGRGGGGFPTWQKWTSVMEATPCGAPRAIICNADEGDPGAFMDRMILESFPFRVIEGLVIAAWTLKAREIVIYVRAEYPLAVERMKAALRLCSEAGVPVGEISGTRGEDETATSWGVRVVEGAGAFVCGEETALIASVEGYRGSPRYRPPYPSAKGLHGWPTLINNVETFASVPMIVRDGAEAFAALGTHGSRGTKTFALAGKVARGGLIEIPMGMSLRTIVERVGGGVPPGRQLKAVQIGGPSGCCVPLESIDTPVDYKALHRIGGIMGSGGLVVLDDHDCMVDIAHYFMSFTARESCGKCTFCRIGTERMLETLERLCTGKATARDVDDLEYLTSWVPQGSLCGLGRTAPNPVASVLRFYREEIDAHLDGCCPAGKCAALVRYAITTDCIGCTRCAQHCPVDAITPRPHQRHEIDDDLCTRCDACRQVCPAGAVIVRSGGRIVRRASAAPQAGGEA